MSKIRQQRRQAPKGYISGFVYTYVSANVLSCSGGYCRSDDDTIDINATSMPNFDITVSGAGGRRVGLVEAASTWYSLWIIADSSGANAPSTLIDTVSSAPTLPTGYDKQRRVGWVRNNSGLVFNQGFVIKAANQYREWHTNGGTASLALSGGAAAAFTDIDLSVWVPPGVSTAYLKAKVTGAAVTDQATWRPNGDTSPTPATNSFAGDAAAGNSIATDTFYMATDVNRIIEYQVTAGATVDLWLLGWVDILN